MGEVGRELYFYIHSCRGSVARWLGIWFKEKLKFMEHVKKEASHAKILSSHPPGPAKNSRRPSVGWLRKSILTDVIDPSIGESQYCSCEELTKLLCPELGAQSVKQKRPRKLFNFLRTFLADCYEGCYYIATRDVIEGSWKWRCAVAAPLVQLNSTEI